MCGMKILPARYISAAHLFALTALPRVRNKSGTNCLAVCGSGQATTNFVLVLVLVLENAVQKPVLTCFRCQLRPQRHLLPPTPT